MVFKYSIRSDQLKSKSEPSTEPSTPVTFHTKNEFRLDILDKTVDIGDFKSTIDWLRTQTRDDLLRMAKENPESILSQLISNNLIETSYDTKKYRCRDWCFTLNNYTQEDIDYLKGLDCVYLVFGKEVGKKKGTPHLQCYIYFKNPCTRQYVSNLLLGKCFVAPRYRNSTPEKASNYCKKDEDYFEKGELPKGQGSRTDIANVKKRVIDDRCSMKELLDEFGDSPQAFKHGENLMKYQGPPLNHKPCKLIWIYGLSGTIKTSSVYSHYKRNYGEDFWMSSKNLQWWTGYNGQKHIIVDEFRSSFCDFNTLLRFFDRYPIQVESKNTSQWARYETVVITSCYHPSKVFETEEEVYQITRRCDHILQFGSNDYENYYKFLKSLKTTSKDTVVDQYHNQFFDYISSPSFNEDDFISQFESDPSQFPDRPVPLVSTGSGECHIIDETEIVDESNESSISDENVISSEESDTSVDFSKSQSQPHIVLPTYRALLQCHECDRNYYYHSCDPVFNKTYCSDYCRRKNE